MKFAARISYKMPSGEQLSTAVKSIEAINFTDAVWKAMTKVRRTKRRRIEIIGINIFIKGSHD